MNIGGTGHVGSAGFDLPIEGPEAPPAEAAPAAAQVGRGTAVEAAASAAGEGKLLTKKLAGERALNHHLDGRIGPKYEAKVIPGADRDHYIVKLHRLSASPPFAVDANPEAVYAVDRRDGKIETISGGTPATTATGAANLGELARPGKALRGSTQALEPGATLRFRTRENQIFGIGEIKVEPRGALDVHRKMIDPNTPGRLGGTTLYEYSFTVPRDAKPGTAVKVTTGGHYQTRNDPDWAFAFSVKVAAARL